ncbi:HNH endonuclease [Clostridiaceae bacterium 35-E11]
MQKQSKKGFIDWLKKNTNIKVYSVNRYANAIDTISAELKSYGENEVNLFNVNDTAVIDKIINNPEFQEKNNRGNRMYSAALKHFKDYVKDYYYELEAELKLELFKEEREFEEYLKDNDVRKNIEIVDNIKERPIHRTIGNYKIWSRNPKLAKDALAYTGYLCEFNSQHLYFNSKYNHQNYVEAHHLIPLEFQEEFKSSLDNYANIVSLCLVCHKQLHYGYFNEKKEILDKLFKSRKERLKASGINIAIDDIYRYYQD